MEKSTFTYDFATDKAYLNVGGVVKEIACFDLKFQPPDITGTSRIWYWPRRVAQQRKAQEILNETGVKPNIDKL